MVKTILNFIRINWFLFAIIFTLFFAYESYCIGIPIKTGQGFTDIIVVVMFLILGLSIESKKAFKGIKNIKLHIYLQLFMFATIPLYFWATAFPFKNYFGGFLIIGIYALASLPTTISSCNAFTGMTGGNVVGSLFNSTFSNIIGIVIFPFLMTLLLNKSGNSLPLIEIFNIFKSLFLKIMFPFVIGQITQSVFGSRVSKHNKKFGLVNSLLILLLVFFAFYGAVSNNVLQSQTKELVIPFLYIAFSNVFFIFLSYIGGKLLKFSREDMITTLFVAPQKTLAMGVPLLSAYLIHASNKLLGIAILPLLFYYLWQLLSAGILKGLIDNKVLKL